MAAYKVLQDVEAEDKILGPLTLRQFIYAGFAAICLYLCYFSATHSATFLIGIFLPVAVIAGFFAFPWGRDQPTEIWALAKIRFMIKPRRRIWDQSGAKELVTVTAPKNDNTDYTNGLSQIEVRSRLRALADTIDSRGWALKNSTVSLYGQPALILSQPGGSDRLVDATSLPQPIIGSDVQAADDIMDEKSNPVAQHMEQMIEAQAKAHRQKIVADLQNTGPGTVTPAQTPNNYWFLNQPAQPANIPNNMVTFNTQVVEPGMEEPASTGMPLAPAVDERQVLAELESHKQQMPGAGYYGHLHMVQPLSAQHQVHTPGAPTATGADAGAPGQVGPGGMQPTAVSAVPGAPNAAANTGQPAVTPAQQAAILQLANNDDLNVATIAREAKRSGEQDEVVIKLH